METAIEEARVARKPGDYARAIGMSRAWLYSLPPELQPKSLKVGRNRLIIEQPGDFLQRLAQKQVKDV